LSVTEGHAVQAPASAAVSIRGAVVVFALLAIIPPLAIVFDGAYNVTLFSRIMIFGIAAISLNLVLGYGGLVSLGHALYIGLGAYAVGICSKYGLFGIGWHLAAVIVAVTVVATLVGWVSLRTSGFSFIMITMAFGQMFYYLAISLKVYGGDEGLVIPMRSVILGQPVLENPFIFYYTILTVLGLAAYTVHRIAASPFGFVLSAGRQHGRRVQTLGYSLARYRLFAYVLSAVMCGVAGVLLANLTHFASPEYMNWVQSGTLIVMVVLGGLSVPLGPLVGATIILLLEEVLSSLTDHWMVVVGPVIVAIVLFGSKGVYGYLVQARESVE
jgi:branched-chain amino acid transport system permease protein